MTMKSTYGEDSEQERAKWSALRARQSDHVSINS